MANPHYHADEAACGDRAAGLAIRQSQKDGRKTPVDAPRRAASSDAFLAISDAGAESVSGVSFTAAPGATIGVIGGTGSGKKHAGQPHPRFYDVTSGRVLVDGMDVHDIRKDELRRRIGVVPQRPCSSRARFAATCSGAMPTPPKPTCATRSRSRRRSTVSAKSQGSSTSRWSRAAAISPAASASALTMRARSCASRKS